MQRFRIYEIIRNYAKEIDGSVDPAIYFESDFNHSDITGICIEF